MPPRPPRPTLFPYTTLFRSGLRLAGYPAYRWRIAQGVKESKELMDFLRWARGQLSDPLLHRIMNPEIARMGLDPRSEEHTSELQSQSNLVCRLLLEKKK